MMMASALIEMSMTAIQMLGYQLVADALLSVPTPIFDLA